MSYDFARYLSLWMSVLHQDERSFWKTATPARLWSLLDAIFRPDGRTGGPESLQTGEKQAKLSLSEYLTGGGG